MLNSLFALGVPEKAPKIVSVSVTYGVTKVDSIMLFFYCNFLKILKKQLLKAKKVENWNGNGKSERKTIMWFMILTTRYESNPEAKVWNDSEKFMSLKKHPLPNSTTAFVDISPNNKKLVYTSCFCFNEHAFKKHKAQNANKIRNM